MSVTPARLASAVAAWLLLLTAPVLAQEADNAEEQGAQLDFLVEPAPGAMTSPGDGWFLLDAEPGTETHQELSIHNRADQSVELALAAVDADTGPIGGASYRRIDEPAEATGTWISLERDRLSLEAGESAVVRFTVLVPQDALSGQHLAGIAVWAPSDVDEVAGVPGAVIAIEQRRVVAVQMALPGPAEPMLRISAVEPQAHPGGVRLLVHITNEGRGLTHGTGMLQVDDGFEQAFEFGTFVPGTAISYPVAWVDGRPREGEFQAHVRLEYDMWSETWDGTFTVGDEIIDELDLFFDESGIPFWWWLAGAGGLLILAASGWGFRRLGDRPSAGPRWQPPRQPRRFTGQRQPASWSSPAPTDPHAVELDSLTPGNEHGALHAP